VRADLLPELPWDRAVPDGGPVGRTVHLSTVHGNCFVRWNLSSRGFRGGWTRVIRRTIGFGLLLVCVLLSLSCVTEYSGSNQRLRSHPIAQPTKISSNEIVEINLMAVPVGLNFDDSPSLDGVSLKLFFMTADYPKAVDVVDGEVEVLMFDGLFVSDNQSPPLKKRWRFDVGELSRYGYESVLGYGYELNLPWGSDVPERNNVSVVVGFRRSDGEWLVSKSSTISVIDPVEPRESFESTP